MRAGAARDTGLGLHRPVPSMAVGFGAGHNVVLLANHQSEADPAVVSLLLESAFPRIATDIAYVAGDRVVSDPICIPFSLGRNLFCVHSKVPWSGGGCCTADRAGSESCVGGGCLQSGMSGAAEGQMEEGQCRKGEAPKAHMCRSDDLCGRRLWHPMAIGPGSKFLPDSGLWTLVVLQKHMDDDPKLKSAKSGANRKALKAMQVRRGLAEMCGARGGMRWRVCAPVESGAWCVVGVAAPVVRSYACAATFRPEAYHMQKALKSGGQLLWVAPSGGRDRRCDGPGDIRWCV